MSNKKLINIVKGDIKSAIKSGNYERSTDSLTNIEFDTKSKQILLDGVAYSNSLIEVTWSELKDLKDNSLLTPGSCYRITDYHCTTTQEDTYSTDHLFDIVLLALSTNKLAELGWAMIHDNVYDVTFNDGVTRKCYIYIVDTTLYIVDTTTLLGTDDNISAITINENNKTATYNGPSSMLSDEDVPYNYFQNSNLSAWKVWYCLDNDTERFIWADGRVTAAIKARIVIETKPNAVLYSRYSEGDVVLDKQYYAWKNNSIVYYTDTETPVSNESSYYTKGKNTMMSIGTINSFVPGQGGTSYGRGVIYRLIDEFNNDVAYDFKNIQFTRKLTDGAFDNNNGEDTWCYTFTIPIDGLILDASTINNVNSVSNNFVGPIFGSYTRGGTPLLQELSYNVIITNIGEIVNAELINSTNNSLSGRIFNVKLDGCDICSLVNINQASTTSTFAFASDTIDLLNGKMYIFSEEVATVSQ